jgi:hypothetical protein
VPGAIPKAEMENDDERKDLIDNKKLLSQPYWL